MPLGDAMSSRYDRLGMTVDERPISAAGKRKGNELWSPFAVGWAHPFAVVVVMIDRGGKVVVVVVDDSMIRGMKGAHCYYNSHSYAD